MATHTFHVRNMHCDDCATLIDDTLRALPGVRDARAVLRTHEIRVELDPRRTSPDAVSATITELGFQTKTPPTSSSVQPAEPVEPQVSDPAWRLVEPLLRDGRPNRTKGARDERQLFEGIAYKHRAAVPWREVPTTFGPWQTLYARSARWRSDGTWTKVAATARRSPFAAELAWIDSVGD
ncbi:transposase [Actinophytocola glycyrrhizae]|uniref:Transposase n=1 Tax=Actinophytocola glycyrrhizae TaxID=2044873 RepID=A0ABV9RWH9_9PSEU